MNYRRWQAGLLASPRPPFLLLHGLASALRIWDFVAAELLRLTGADIVALDQRGHGLSDKPENGYTTAQIVAHDHTLSTALGLTKPIIVGHSWGATIGLAYAALYPEEVSALVMVDGGMGNLRDRPGATWERTEQELAPPDFAGTPKEAFLDYFRQGAQGEFFGPIWSPQLEDIILNIVEVRDDGTVGPRLSRDNHMQILRSMWDTDNLAMASQVRCPVLMISAETSPAEGLPPGQEAQEPEWFRLKREGAARMQTALTLSPRVEFTIINSTVHDIPLQRPALLAQEIVRFVQASGVISA